MRILIVKLGSIGDVVHTLPALAALRCAMPASHLAWVVERGGAAQLLRGNPCLDELIEFIGVADIYISPHLDQAQIVSGTLSYACGAGKAVVSTPYWHAQELLAEEQVEVPGSKVQFPTTVEQEVGGKKVTLVLTGVGMRKKFLVSCYAMASYVQQGEKISSADDLISCSCCKLSACSLCRLIAPGGSITCTATPSTSTMRVRSTSCRCTSSCRLFCSAATSSTPSSNSGQLMLYVLLGPSSWYRNQNRSCAEDST